jgi:hypothetical protein
MAQAAAQAPEERLIILPVDLEDASVEAVSWAAKSVRRHGASTATTRNSMRRPRKRGAARAAAGAER